MSSIGSIYDAREREERDAVLRNTIRPVRKYGLHDASSPEPEFTTTITDYTGVIGESSVNYDPQAVEIEFKRDKKPLMTKQARNIIFAFLNVFFNVTANVGLPIYAATMDYIKSDAYVLLSQAAAFFVVIFLLMTFVLQRTFDRSITFKPSASYKILFVMGTLTTLNGVLVVYASPPDRTPPYLQGILMTMTIPYTVLFRLIWLRKGLSFARVLCVGAVMVGLFITSMPQIWGLPGSGSGSAEINHSALTRILWPLCFAIGFIPAGIMNVICEKELKKGEGNSLSFLTWSQIFQLVTMYMVFWSDFIPGFGMSASASEFVDKLHSGWSCLFSTSEACHGLLGKAWIFYIGYSLGNLFNFLLIQYAEGAVYAAVVQAVISPSVALFWTLFQFDVESDRFYWGPKITETTGFVFVGVCILVPGVVLYNHFSIQEEKERKRNIVINSS